MATPTTKKRGPNRGGERPYPPTDSSSPSEWRHLTATRAYRKRVKRAISRVSTLKLLNRDYSPITGTQRDAIHFLLDPWRIEMNRRVRRNSEPTTESNATPTKSLLY